jgi:membrane protein YqaA with SNARE-associated domain
LARTVELLKAIAKFLVRYKAWIMGMLAGVSGPWAVLIIAFVDAGMFGIPIDPIVAYYVAIDPRHALLFAVMGAVGSAGGSLIPFAIGYKGGEALVARKMGPERFGRMHARSEKYGDLALIIPALMPPGFPFKAFVLMAGVTEMGTLHFLLSVFLGRLLRFLILGSLIIAYGPEILSFLAAGFKHHRGLFFLVVALVVAAIWLAVKLGSRRRGAAPEMEAPVD